MSRTSKRKIICAAVAVAAMVPMLALPMAATADEPVGQMRGNPEKLAIYYGDPGAVNGAAGNVSTAVDTFNDYDLVVFGEGIEQATHPYHGNTQSIIGGIATSTRSYGYVDLCVQNPQSSLYRCSNFAQDELQRRIDSWQAMGAKGIFLDQAGCEYVVSRDRFNATIDYVHARGMSAFVNVWNVPEAFEPGSVPSPYAGYADCNPNRLPTKLGANDYELLESWGTVLSDWSENWSVDPNATVRRGEQMMKYAAQYGTKGATVNTVGYNNPPFDKAKFDWGWWLTSLYGMGAMGWGESWVYSADTNSMPFHARPTPGDLGNAVSNATVVTSGNISTRQTSTGTIRLDRGTHTGGFVLSNTPTTVVPPTTSPSTTVVPPTTSPSTTTPAPTTSTIKPTTTVPPATTTTTLRPTTTSTTVVNPPTNGWVACAKNGKTCTLKGTEYVRYGEGNFWSVRSVTGSVTCSAAAFGDPNPSATKTCQRNNGLLSVGPFTGMGYTQCAGEGGRCSFTGTKQVVFGNSGWYSTRTVTGGVDCTAQRFGDPLPGISKVCWVR